MVLNGNRLYTVTFRTAQAKMEEQGVNLPSHLRPLKIQETVVCRHWTQGGTERIL